MDRTIHFGDDAADARYRIQDTSSAGGDLVLAEDLDGGTVLLEYDYSASEWVSRGPVNLSGNDITNAGAITADSLEANVVARDYLYAGSFTGTGADTRLSNALSTATDNQTIYLENTTYTDDRTISKDIRLCGTVSGGAGFGTSIQGDYTFDGRVFVQRISGGNVNSTYTVNGVQSKFYQCHFRGEDSVTIAADQVLYVGNYGASITFENGNSGGIVDGCPGATVTDNDGGNTVGDIA